MTKTVSSLVKTSAVGPIKLVTVDVNITSYTNGGEPLTPSDLNMKKFLAVIPTPNENYGYSTRYNYTDEVIEALYADYDGSADAVLIQVPDTTDVGVVRVVVFGV